MRIERWQRRRVRANARKSQRRAELEARVRRVQRRAREIVEDVATPFVAAGVTRIEQSDEWIELSPLRKAATSARLWPDSHIASPNVGPEANLHEVLVRDDNA